MALQWLHGSPKLHPDMSAFIVRYMQPTISFVDPGYSLPKKIEVGQEVQKNGRWGLVRKFAKGGALPKAPAPPSPEQPAFFADGPCGFVAMKNPKPALGDKPKSDKPMGLMSKVGAFAYIALIIGVMIFGVVSVVVNPMLLITGVLFVVAATLFILLRYWLTLALAVFEYDKWLRECRDLYCQSVR